MTISEQDTKAVLMAWQNLSYNVQTERWFGRRLQEDAYLVEYTPDYSAST